MEDFSRRCLGSMVRVGIGEGEENNARQASRRRMTGSRTRKRILMFINDIKFDMR
jgi:hypothetical protein